MRIEGREISLPRDYLAPVTYIPKHSESASHRQGVIVGINITSNLVRVLYCKSRTVQTTNPDDLVWG